MLAGADAARIHATYVVRGMEMLEEVELYAVLASAGDREAWLAIEAIAGELDALAAALEQDPG